MFTKRLHTSEQAKNILLDLKKKTGLLPNALGRIAIIKSLAEEEDVTENFVKEEKPTQYNANKQVATKGKGLEFMPDVLFGNQNALLYALVKESNNDVLEHLEKGAIILKRMYHMAGNREKFIEMV